MSQGYYDMITSLAKRVEKLEKEQTKNTNVGLPLWKQVLEQKDWYNGHGQMEISEMSLEDVMILIDDLEDNYKGAENMFYVKLFNDLGASICQTDEKDTLWLSIGRVNL